MNNYQSLTIKMNSESNTKKDSLIINVLKDFKESEETIHIDFCGEDIGNSNTKLKININKDTITIKE